MSGDGIFRRQFAAKAGKVHSELPSTSHWRGVRDLVGERLGADPSVVYVSTVSKPGNVSVRFFQSKTAVKGRILVAMYTGDTDEVDRTIDALRTIAIEREGIGVVAREEGSVWDVVAVTADPDDAKAKSLVGEFPGAKLVGF